jgi:hypothetical protein
MREATDRPFAFVAGRLHFGDDRGQAMGDWERGPDGEQCGGSGVDGGDKNAGGYR